MKRFTGYAAVFRERTLIGNRQYGFWEEVDPGAFDGVLREGQDVRFQVNHEGLPLARTKNRTMTLSVDRRGLKVAAALADTQDGRDLAVLLERRDVDQMSFGFTVKKDRWEKGPEGLELRVVEEVDELYDVSAVTFAAYPTTTAALMSEEEAAAQRLAAMRLRLCRTKLNMALERMSPDERFKLEWAATKRRLAARRAAARR